MQCQKLPRRRISFLYLEEPDVSLLPEEKPEGSEHDGLSRTCLACYYGHSLRQVKLGAFDERIVLYGELFEHCRQLQLVILAYVGRVGYLENFLDAGLFDLWCFAVYVYNLIALGCKEQVEEIWVASHLASDVLNLVNALIDGLACSLKIVCHLVKTLPMVGV